MSSQATGERGRASAVALDTYSSSLASQVIHSLPDPLIVLDSDFRIKLANAAFYETFAVSPQQSPGLSLENLPDPSWRQVRALITEMFAQDKRLRDLQVDFQFADRPRRTFNLAVHRMTPAGDGGSRLLLLQLEDVTLQRKTEAAREVETADLERSNSDLEQFAYVASHDLQEPLRMVASFTQLLAKRYQGQLDAEADEFIGYAVDGARRMQALVNDLLAYSRVGRRGLQLTSTSCAEILTIVQQDLRSAISESGAVITQENLPIVEADPVQLRQLFQNLLANAIKFRSEEPLQIRVFAKEGASEWTLCVQDNGIGIPEGQRERIFDIFQRLHSRAEYPGTGIGLAVCKKIVERHGGRIWAESEVGQGTTFLFTLPLNSRSKS